MGKWDEETTNRVFPPYLLNPETCNFVFQVFGKVWGTLATVQQIPRWDSVLGGKVHAGVGNMYLLRREQPHALGPKILQKSLDILHLPPLFLAPGGY